MSPSPVSLEGRVVLVTGASSGLGAHFAKLLVAHGARVALAARRKDRLEALVRELGARAVAVEMDVTSEPSVIAGFDAAEQALGPIDSVIANAGTSVAGSALELKVEAFDQLMAVNVRGVFLTAREGARRMVAHGAKDRRHGRILLIASLAATHVEPGLAAYSGSKAAVRQFGRVLARDLVAAGVNVNTLCPGYIETELNQAWFQSERGQKQIARMPRKRLQSASSLDAMVLFLCGDASAETTGASFELDDGQSLG